jgi:ATP-dependent protease ClpP protease subunit
MIYQKRSIHNNFNLQKKNRKKFLTAEEAKKWGLKENRVFKSGDIAEFCLQHQQLIS